MPAAMDTPLDFTDPAWYRTDGTARTIRGGTPSLRAPSVASGSDTHSAQGRSLPRSMASSTRSSAAASSTHSNSVNALTRAPHTRRPRANSTAKGPAEIATTHVPSKPAVASASVAEAPTPLKPTRSQLRRTEQAGRFRVSPRAAYAETQTHPVKPSGLATERTSMAPMMESTLAAPGEISGTRRGDKDGKVKATERDAEILEQLRRWEELHEQARRAESLSSKSSTSPPVSKRPVTSRAITDVNPETNTTLARHKPPAPRRAHTGAPRAGDTPTSRSLHTRPREQVAQAHAHASVGRRKGGQEDEYAAAKGHLNTVWVPPRRDVDAETKPGESWYRPAPPKAKVSKTPKTLTKSPKTQNAGLPKDPAHAWAESAAEAKAHAASTGPARGWVTAVAGWF